MADHLEREVFVRQLLERPVFDYEVLRPDRPYRPNRADRRPTPTEIVERTMGAPSGTGCTCELCSGYPTPGADGRARDLLLSFLDERQKEELRTTGMFHLVGSDGLTYRIGCSDYSGNVIQYVNGQATRSLCCYPRYTFGQVPIADRILGQFLALKTEATRFVSIAY